MHMLPAGYLRGGSSWRSPNLKKRFHKYTGASQELGVGGFPECLEYAWSWEQVRQEWPYGDFFPKDFLGHEGKTWGGWELPSKTSWAPVSPTELLVRSDTPFSLPSEWGQSPHFSPFAVIVSCCSLTLIPYLHSYAHLTALPSHKIGRMIFQNANLGCITNLRDEDLSAAFRMQIKSLTWPQSPWVIGPTSTLSSFSHCLLPPIHWVLLPPGSLMLFSSPLSFTW